MHPHRLLTITKEATYCLTRSILRQDSDDESARDLTGHVYGAVDNISHDSDTEIPKETERQLPCQPMLYEGAGEYIEDVKDFEQEQSNLCHHPWSPFSSAQRFKLGSWFIEGKVPTSQINEYISSGVGNASSAGIFPCIRLRTSSRHWIDTVHIFNGTKGRLMMASEHCDSSIATF